ncbi:MAG: maleylacetate reductase [Acidimicrobiaceae bacterium]|nr:maleylacetate reductase [Acidimicrobiaceae bacterium]
MADTTGEGVRQLSRVEGFTYDALPGRVVFGSGSRKSLAAEAEALGAERILVIADRAEDALASEIGAVLGDLVVSRFDQVAQHVPVPLAEAAAAQARDVGADTVLTIGGGSATGFGKAVVLNVGIKQIAVPTTYAGSEMTPIWGMSDGDRKQVGVDARAKPALVVYDPELTLTLPPRIAGPSGMNALAHAVEALYGPGANPFISFMALEGIRVLHRGLPAVVADPDDLDARTDGLYGAYLGGVVLGTGGTALHHKTCHVLGGMFNLDHGGMNAAVLGHAVAYNAPAIEEIIQDMAAVIDVPARQVPAALFDLASAIGAPTSLEALGMPADGLDEAARRVVIEAAANVRPPMEDGIRQMLDDAFHGRRPA